MNRRIPWIALAVLMAWPLSADETESSAEESSLLQAMIELEESTEKKGVLPLSFGVEPQDVDVNSTIKIKVSAKKLTDALADRSDLASQISPEVADLVKVSEQLRGSVAALEKGIELAAQLAAILAGGDGDFGEVAGELQRSYLQAFAPLKPYWNALKASAVPRYQRHAVQSRNRANAALTVGAGKGRAAFLRYLVQEVDWVVGELDKAREKVSAEPPAMALILSAVHRGKAQSQELGLPNYNRIEVGEPQRYEKLSLVPSAEQLEEIRRLQGEAVNLADALKPLLNEGLGSLQGSLGGLTGRLGFGEVKTAFNAVKADLGEIEDTDWGAVAEGLEDNLQSALEIAVDDDAIRQQLEGLESEIGSLVDGLKSFTDELGSLEDALRGLTLDLPDLAAGSDSVDFLTDLLARADSGTDLVSGAEAQFGDLVSGAREWIDDVQGLGTRLKDFRGSLLDLPDDVSLDFEDVLGDVDDSALVSLAENLESLRDEVEEFIGNLRGLVAEGGFFKNFKSVVDGKDSVVALADDLDDLEPPETSYPVRLANVKNTYLDIQTVNPRQEGDALSLRAWLYRVAAGDDEDDDGSPDVVETRELLDREVQELRLFRFGWYTAPSVGLTYLTSIDDIANADAATEEDPETGEQVPIADRHKTFVPHVSWMFRYRSWKKEEDGVRPARYSPRFGDSFGIGIHTIPLDFDNNDQLEVGFGFTVSLLNDFLQIGGGINLNLDEEPYVFLGTRLFNLANGLGIKNSPAGFGGD